MFGAFGDCAPDLWGRTLVKRREAAQARAEGREAPSLARPRDEHDPHFTALVDHRLVDAGHDLPQEAPDEFARAVLDLRG